MRFLIQILGRVWKVLSPDSRRWLARRFQTSFTASAAALITNDKGQVLLLDHVLRPHSGWGVAGGFLERGEQPEGALRREVREETGLELSNIRLIRVRTQHRHLEIAFRAEAVGTASVCSPEITRVQWFDRDKMPAEMSPSQKAFILSVLEGELE